MSRYIDADLLKDKTTRVNNIWNGTTNAEGKGLDEIIDDIPTADVRENVKGRWVEYPDCLKYDGAIMQEDFVCPECKAVFSAIDNEGERFNYCPNCGADMRGEANE